VNLHARRVRGANSNRALDRIVSCIVLHSSRSAKHSRAVGRSKLDPVQLRRILIADIAHWLASNYL
jgi:hypothetical protein